MMISKVFQSSSFLLPMWATMPTSLTSFTDQLNGTHVDVRSKGDVGNGESDVYNSTTGNSVFDPI